MPLALVKYYTAEIISALELMHSKGMIHRDLKPENILITDDWHLKIVRLFSLMILRLTLEMLVG
jgi:3-phosphoinositide dependent protein kinase-1